MTEHPITFSDRMRTLTGGMMSHIGLALYRFGIHPDMLTIIGLLLVGIAALFIGVGQHFFGAVILFFALPFDALDGAVARAMKREGRFGEMLDSSLDRYADGFIFAALSYHFAQQDDLKMLVLTQIALLGTFMVSYARARADGVNVVVKIGLFTRLERTVVILVMLLVPQLLVPGVWVLAIGTNFTAMQRIFFVYKALK